MACRCWVTIRAKKKAKLSPGPLEIQAPHVLYTQRKTYPALSGLSSFYKPHISNTRVPGRGRKFDEQVTRDDEIVIQVLSICT
jgi:hypothetical protein